MQRVPLVEKSVFKKIKSDDMNAEFFLTNKIRQVDYLFNSVYLKSFGEKKSLIIFLFHVLFRNENESCLNAVQPAQGMLLRHFRQFIEYYQRQDYIFISPDDILKGLDDDKNYALITFDDGYYNNQYALPILKQYKIPALFFISTDYVKQNKSFWWDALHREKVKRGILPQAISKEINLLGQSMTNEEIEKSIKDEFGKEALNPKGDIDRPFTPSELRDFSKEKFVFLGNHTSKHPTLTNCSPEEIAFTIRQAQNDLYDITGEVPNYLSYPHGAYSDEIVEITKQTGLKLGITVDDRKNYLPIEFENDNTLRLGRFALQKNDQIERQCLFCRRDIRLSKIAKRLVAKG